MENKKITEEDDITIRLNQLNDIIKNIYLEESEELIKNLKHWIKWQNYKDDLFIYLDNGFPKILIKNNIVGNLFDKIEKDNEELKKYNIEIQTIIKNVIKYILEFLEYNPLYKEKYVIKKEFTKSDLIKIYNMIKDII